MKDLVLYIYVRTENNLHGSAVIITPHLPLLFYSKNRKHRKMKFSDDCCGSDLSGSEEIESLNDDSFATSKAGISDSQATSKAGLSIDSQNIVESQQLKVIVPDEFAPDENPDCSADSSPRCHKPTAQNCAQVAPPLPKPVTPETCFYFLLVPYVLQTMKKLP